MLDLSPMNSVVVDPEQRTAVAQAGVNWGEFDAATQEHGLATTGGRVTTTGIAGLTLGTGSGWLERLHGYTADNLIAADVITADGRAVRASEDENADLFWGLRGGGGNFGVVTSFEYRLHEIGPMVMGGMVIWPVEMAGDVLRFYREFIADAPDEVGGGVAIITAPPAPFVPPEMQGKHAVAVIACAFTDPERGEELLRPIREFRSPAVDIVGPMPYVAVQQLLDPGNPPGLHNYWKAELVEELTDELIDLSTRARREGCARLALAAVLPAARRPDLAHSGRRERDHRAARRLDASLHRRVGDARGDGRRARVGEGVGPDDRAVQARRRAADVQRRHRRRARAGDVRRGEVRAPRRAEGQVRPGEPLPAEPEHQAERLGLTDHGAGGSARHPPALGHGPGRATTRSSSASAR